MRSKNFDIPRLQDFDGQEWRRLEERYHDRIFAYVRRQIGHPDAAEDLTQDVFLGALKGIGNFDARYNIEQFLMGIARNKVIDHLRRKKIEVQVPDRDEDSSGFFGTTAGEAPASAYLMLAREKVSRQKEALIACLKEMVRDLIAKDDLRKLMAIELCFLTSRKHRDIAKYLEIPDEKAIAGIKFRAIRDLQGRLRHRDPRKTLFSGLWERI